MGESRFVVNASPLIFLAQIKALSILSRLAREVIVPVSVQAEVRSVRKATHPLQRWRSPSGSGSSRTFLCPKRFLDGIWEPETLRSLSMPVACPIARQCWTTCRQGGALEASA